MSGYAGLRPARKLRRGISVSRRHSQSSKVECAGLVVGLVAFIERKNEIIFPT